MVSTAVHTKRRGSNVVPFVQRRRQASPSPPDPLTRLQQNLEQLAVLNFSVIEVLDDMAAGLLADELRGAR